jgi:hypothetical protein
MIPVGYLAKRSVKKPDGFTLECVEDVYSVGSCVNDDFVDYSDYYKHNGYWLFDSPEVIQSLATEHSIELQETLLFYYEAYELQFDGKSWISYAPEPAVETHVSQPFRKRLEGFDVVTFYCGNAPECSPLSCNCLAQKVSVNSHCLFSTFEEAETQLSSGGFDGCEPGPYRIFAVYSVDWP